MFKSTRRPRNVQLFVVTWLGCFVAATTGLAEDWLQFRGSHFTGSTTSMAQLPESWDDEAKQNIAWKVELPGEGPSSPIVVEDRVVVTSSGGRRQSEIQMLAFAVADGELLWKRTLSATGRTLTHSTSANAAPTPASDGEFIVAFYSSNDLICVDLEGNLKWFRGLAFDYPKLGNDIGMASSPLIIGDTVVVQAESQGESFAAGINLATGENRWKINRDKQGNWTSPAIFRADEGSPPLVLLQSGSSISAHDPLTGDEHWRFDVECDRIASPVAVGNEVFVAAEGLTKLRVEYDEPDVAWGSAKLAPGSSSPVVHAGRVYTVARAGVLNCADAASGDLLWKLRLGIGRQWATPAACGNRLYCFDSDGRSAVVDLAAEAGRVVSTPELGEPIKASPAIVNDAIFIRSDRHLWKLTNSTDQ